VPPRRRVVLQDVGDQRGDGEEGEVFAMLSRRAQLWARHLREERLALYLAGLLHIEQPVDYTPRRREELCHTLHRLLLRLLEHDGCD